MKNGMLTKSVLIVLFIGFFITATISYTLWRSHADNTIAYIALIIIAVIIWVFAHIRLKEIWENKTYFAAVGIVLLMIIFPITSPMALYYLLKTPKIPTEKNKFLDTEEKYDNTMEIVDNTMWEQKPSTNSWEIVKIIGFVIFITIILIIASLIFEN